MKHHIPVKIGDVIINDGRKIGEHGGVWFYTIGQRHIKIRANLKTLNPHGVKRHDPRPMYVANKDLKTNTLVVTEDNDD